MKTAIVTGATRGIGKVIARHLSDAGYNLVLNYRTPSDSLTQFAETLKTKVLFVQGDVSDYNAAEDLVKKAIDTFGQVDLLVNNAGITKDNLIIRMSEAEFDSVIQTNLKGSFNCLRHVARNMMKQRSGRIINISSVVGLKGNIGQANYAASKAGVIGLTKTAARELAPRGVTVNAIAPGFIKTDMTDALSENAKKAALSQIPLGSFGSAEDVSNLVLFLASDQSAYITGQIIQVDGGMAI
ncbi:3-oxoacyl-[acyl-carrier-protein] reductase [Fusibacter tunisiensis]|uniref:3-oxoacyl-[acyl-carrier-protein] reductase n=1 Tax=Fusibacter tunisiensis TaxID=1008308 RepID=A0ABS2MRK6_9FIRM|nr:3-oxoacyl-[acyl-carrier-protein] reductase [Fusibacter tunisiensis]MBM7562006.1 3-oxoacyl-[acyl-carrier protein] reductase [Fusibacter tunisiensis]